MGCASGKNAGPRNIFGNKYGQNLAAVQIAREKRLEAKRQKEAQEAANARLRELQQQQHEEETDDDDDNAETDDDSGDDDDYGPTPAAGIWAGSQKLRQESEKLADPDGDPNDDDAGDEETDDEEEQRPAKKVRADD